ncbi:MAG: MlaD family protein [Segniliparus sp.]|uniref:MlaD family protein n=1 Tax=Segniliparus sp. TaxID=2804064 RepID=UPI003F30C52F
MAVFQDLSGRAAGKKSLRWRGVIVALAATLVFIVARSFYAGTYTPSFKIDIDATSIGEGLAEGADVKYRGLVIGKVESINMQTNRKQVIRLSLDPKQAHALRGIASAKYQSSNIFGAPAIELLSGNDNTPLRENTTVKIDSSGKVASITSALRQIASLTTLLGTDKVQRLLRLVTQNGDILASVVQEGFSFGKIYADNLRKPVIALIQDATPLANGFSLVIGPAVRELEALYDHSEFLAIPESRDATIEATQNHRVMIFDELGATLNHINPDGVDSLGFLIDIGHPLFMSAGSAASAWGNLETFINRVEDAMPSIDGKVKLRLEVLLPASRALPQPDESDGQEPQSGQGGQSQRQLTPQQQQQVQELQTQLLGRVPQQLAQQQAQPQQAQQAQPQQAQSPTAPQQQPGPGQQTQPQQAGSDFATIPTQNSEGGPR